MEKYSEYEKQLIGQPDLYNNPPVMGAAPSEVFNSRKSYLEPFEGNGGGDAPVSGVKPLKFEVIGGGNGKLGLVYIEVAENTGATFPELIIEYSLDGKTWLPVEWGQGEAKTSIINYTNAMYLRGYNPDGLSLFDEIGGKERTFVISPMGAETKVSGNIMSLIDYEHETTTILSAMCFTNLFNTEFSSIFGSDGTLVDASELELPATTLAVGCYYAMFAMCTNLTTAPELPATTLANGCYYHMFDGCTSLINAPQLDATELAENCYKNMFDDCYSLIKNLYYDHTFPLLNDDEFLNYFIGWHLFVDGVDTGIIGPQPHPYY